MHQFVGEIAGAGFEKAPYRTVFLFTKSEGIFMNHFESKNRQLGQGMTEYIIIVALIAVAAIGVYSFFGETIRAQMAGMTNELAGKDGTANVTKAAAAAGKADGATGAKNLGNYSGSQK